MRSRFSVMAELADDIRRVDFPLVQSWEAVSESFESWIHRPGLREQLRDHLRTLPADLAAEVVQRSRETTTHFAWCLRDREEDPFSFWLHEYKPQRDWRPGYADSVHNHRYHFCTTILRGCYVHERFEAELDATRSTILSATLLRSSNCPPGASGTMLAEEFHRIPYAADGTMTFLIKSRPVSRWSLSFDPQSQVSRQHLPVESRMDQLVNRI